MRSIPRFARVTVTAIAAVALLAGSAEAVTRTPAYGKPGAVGLFPVQGGFVNSDHPSITFPKHVIARSRSAPRSVQRFCTFFQVTQAPVPPATTWTVAYTSKQFCASLPPGAKAEIGNHVWTGQTNGPKTSVEYHARFVVTWAVKKKRLARATYDFTSVGDYKCLTTICHVGQAADNTAYILFDL